MARSHCGPLVKEWRTRRHRSQLDLALDVGVSARHLSFVETGRSRPSPELLLAIADRLEVPLREQNTLLVAAGYAPRYAERSLDDPAMRHVHASLQRMLDAHDPYPGVVIDRQWNVVLANGAAALLVEGLPPTLLSQPLNVYRLCLHPEGLAARTTNFAEWSAYLLSQLRRTIALTGDAELQRLWQEVSQYPNVDISRQPQGGEPPLLVPVRLTIAGPTGRQELSMFTTLTTFGTPRDVTLDELAVELFFPEDEATELALRAAQPESPSVAQTQASTKGSNGSPSISTE